MADYTTGDPTSTRSAPAPGTQDYYLQTNTAAGDAWAQLSQTLSQYGLGSLTDLVKTGIVNGWDAAQAAQNIRQTPEYKQRFAAIIERQAKGLPPISEADVINLEHQYTQTFQAAGLPSGLYDNPQDFTSYIVNDVSPSEMQDRVQKGVVAAQNAPPEVKAMLQGYYGVTDGELASFFLNPDATEQHLMKQFTAAQIGGASQRTGFGDIGAGTAEGLVNLGVTGDQAQQGFGALAGEKQLFNSLPGEQGQNITQDQQLAAQFGGDATQQQRIKDAADARKAAFQSGGNFATDKGGFGGVGAAR